MSSKTSTWRRPATRVYDYNYKYGEQYYNPQLSHIDKKERGVTAEPPGAKTFAERYSENPFYGKARDFDRSNSDAPSRSYSVPPADAYTPRQQNGDDDSAPRRRPRFNFDEEPAKEAGRPRQPVRTALDDEIDGLMKDLDNIPRRRRIILTPDSEDLNADSVLKGFTDRFDSKLRKSGFASPTDDVTKKIVDYHVPSLDDEKRRLRMKNLEEELSRLGTTTEIVRPARRQPIEDYDLAENFESSMKIKKRNVKATYTTETVRY